ncbi:DUF2232 domain-containing protein [Paenibacillus psychroresistens]|nr:DUF2232 domain-containing protein [Paenibacillus psychroresistens]
MTPTLRQSLLWCAVLIIELLSLVTPLNFLTITLIMVPLLILYLKLDLKQFSLAYVSSLFVLFVILGGSGLSLLLIIYSLFFIPPAIAMGQLYKKRASIRVVLMIAILVVIAEILLLLFMGYSTGVDPIGHLKIFLTDSVASLPKAMLPVEYLEFSTDYIEKAIWMLPFLLLLFATFYVFLTHAITRRLLKKSTSPLPGLPPMHEWRLPKSMVLYFLIVLIIGLIITEKSDLYFQMIVYNLLPLFMVLFAVQAIGLLYAFVHFKKWNRFIPLVMILLCLYPPVTYVVCLLGVMDILMPLRQRFFKI